MWLFWLVVIAIAWYWFSQKSKSSSASRGQKSPEVTVTVSSNFTRDSINVDLVATSDNGFQIGTNLSFPVTLYGLDKAEAEKLAIAMQQGQDYEISEWFTHLVAQKNIRCKELDDWLNKAKPQFQELIQKRIAANQNWSSASELDKADMLEEFKADAVLELPVRPALTDATLTLLDGEPSDLTVDDVLLEKFKDNPQTYNHLLYALSTGSKVVISPTGDYRRKALDELADKGFMRRGRDIPTVDILGSLTLKEMQEIAGSDAPKKFTRKANAVEFLMALPDLQLRLERIISFRSLFQLKPIDGIDLEEISKAYAYSKEVARIILQTLRSDLDSQRTKESAKEWVPEEGWELHAEDCCPSCRQQHGKKWKRLPQKLPPFHIGCECRIY